MSVMDTVEFYGREYARMGGESVGALYFLHGRRGQCPGRVDPWVSNVLPVVEEDLQVVIDWTAGTVQPKTGNHTRQSQRLGKWLAKEARKGHTSIDLGHLLDVFQKRTPGLEWVITCDPAEVLAMSDDRPWTSCMRPGGQYEEGPVSDYLAGSALLLFFRPEAGQPCGREILRPAVSAGEPVIVRARTQYGVCGTVLNESIVHEGEPMVKYGPLSEMRGIFAGIYDDYAREEVSQGARTDEEEAGILLNAFWPWMRPIQLSTGLDVTLRYYQSRWAERALEAKAKAREEARAEGESIRHAERGRYARQRQAQFESLCAKYGRRVVCEYLAEGRRRVVLNTEALARWGLMPCDTAALGSFRVGSRRGYAR